MQTISAGTFYRRTQKNTEWAKSLTDWTHVEGQIDLEGSHIRCLSPWLVFTEPAVFTRCMSLKKAEGHFESNVSFKGSGIREISPDFQSTWDTWDDNTPTADFQNCRNLTVARGTFAGIVDFAGSPIHTIRGLKCRQGWFINCMDVRRVDAENLAKIGKTIILPAIAEHKILREEKARRLLKEKNSQPIEL